MMTHKAQALRMVVFPRYGKKTQLVHGSQRIKQSTPYTWGSL
jgi:hypothetical protein